MAPGRIAAMLALLLAGAAAFALAAAALPSVSVDGFWAALLATALVGIVNALAWPLLIRFALPLTVLTLGLGALVLNGAIVLLVAAVLPDVDVDSLGGAVIVALATTGFAFPGEEVVGAEAMHRRMRRWLADLGHTEFA